LEVKFTTNNPFAAQTERINISIYNSIGTLLGSGGISITYVAA
jgi:hypothetical protein